MNKIVHTMFGHIYLTQMSNNNFPYSAAHSSHPQLTLTTVKKKIFPPLNMQCMAIETYSNDKIQKVVAWEET